MAFNKHSLPDRLRNKTVAVADCLIFEGSKDARGYGLIRVNGKWAKAHRKAYEIAKGPIPNGMVIMHTCDKPACINPEHLIAGSQQQNMADMRAKGRANKPQGESNPRSKLTEREVIEIRRQFIRGDREHGANALSRKYSVSKTVIQHIISGKTWAHLIELKTE